MSEVMFITLLAVPFSVSHKMWRLFRQNWDHLKLNRIICGLWYGQSSNPQWIGDPKIRFNWLVLVFHYNAIQVILKYYHSCKPCVLHNPYRVIFIKLFVQQSKFICLFRNILGSKVGQDVTQLCHVARRKMQGNRQRSKQFNKVSHLSVTDPSV